jgi:hypothetical protein
MNDNTAQLWWDQASEEERTTLLTAWVDQADPGKVLIESLAAADVPILIVQTDSGGSIDYGNELRAFMSDKAEIVDGDLPVRSSDVMSAVPASQLKASQWVRLDDIGDGNGPTWLRVNSIQPISDHTPGDDRLLIFAILNDVRPVFLKAPPSWKFAVTDDPLESVGL